MTDFFTKLFEILFSWVYRFKIVRPDEEGIKLTCGKWKRNLEPGLHWYWPLISSVEVVNIKPQCINLANQVIRGIAVSGVIEYIVEDACNAILHVQDYDEAIPNVAMGIISLHVSDGLEGLPAAVMDELAEKTEPWGIKVTSVTITDYSPCFTIAMR